VIHVAWLLIREHAIDMLMLLCKHSQLGMRILLCKHSQTHAVMYAQEAAAKASLVEQEEMVKMTDISSQLDFVDVRKSNGSTQLAHVAAPRMESTSAEAPAPVRQHDEQQEEQQGHTRASAIAAASDSVPTALRKALERAELAKGTRSVSVGRQEEDAGWESDDQDAKLEHARLHSSMRLEHTPLQSRSMMGATSSVGKRERKWESEHATLQNREASQLPDMIGRTRDGTPLDAPLAQHGGAPLHHPGVISVKHPSVLNGVLGGRHKDMAALRLKAKVEGLGFASGLGVWVFGVVESCHSCCRWLKGCEA
jgi:hypothetical protein